ncbi:MAG: hypothetical protein AAGF73_14620 [Actinomycetota bacterium]
MPTFIEELAAAERASPGFADNLLAAESTAERATVFADHGVSHLADHPDLARVRALSEAKGVPPAELRLDEHELRELLGELTLDDIEHPALREMFSSASAPTRLLFGCIKI